MWPGREPRGSAFEDLPHRVELADLLPVEVRDDMATPGFESEQPLGHQAAQGFADWRPRHAEPRADLGFANAVAGLVAAMAYGLAHALAHLVRT